MNYNEVKEYLISKGANLSLLENPAFNVCDRIIDIARRSYWMTHNGIEDFPKADAMIKFYLDDGISIDEKGNVSMLSPEQTKSDSTSREKNIFSVNDNGEYIHQVMFKSCHHDEVNNHNQHLTRFYLREHIYDNSGIESIIRKKEFIWCKDSLSDAIYLATNDNFLSDKDYNVSSSLTTMREVKRNYDLGSASVKYECGENGFAYNVQLLGEDISRLTIDHDASYLLSSISKDTNLRELRENNSSLSFA